MLNESDPDEHPAAAPTNRYQRRNYLLGVANGTLGRSGYSFIDSQLVLSAFVYELTRSNALVGLLVSLTWLGRLWPQLYISSRIEHKPRKKPYYIAGSVVRIVMLAAMSLSIWRAGGSGDSWALPIFYVALFIFYTAQGCASIAFMDLIGQTIRSARFGRFFGARGILGDAVALMAGYFLVQPLLERLSFPMNYAAIVALAILAFGSAWGTYSFVKETPSPSPPTPRRMRDAWREAMETLRKDRNYKGLLALRVLFRCSSIALAFFVPYGVERLGAVGMAGVFVGTLSGSRLLASHIWGVVSEKRGNRFVLMFSGVFSVVAPLIALIAPALPALFEWSPPGSEMVVTFPICVYVLALVAFGVANRAYMIGNISFMLETAPPDRRPSYIAFLNTISFPLTLLPLAVGLWTPRGSGLNVVFYFVVVTGALTFAAAHALREVRVRG